MTIAALTKITSRLSSGLNRLQPVWWLLVRVWMARVFFVSGLTKIENFDNTVLLFADEYKVPLLSPYFAALSSTFFELAMPVALVLGLATRLAVLPLLAITAVVQFTYLERVEHIYWAILLIGLIIHGAGKYSLDCVIAKRLAP